MTKPGNHSALFRDETGNRYGRYLVLLHLSYGEWLCRCDCGRYKIVRADSLRQGLATQCRSCAAKAQIERQGSPNTRRKKSEKES